MGTLLLSLFPGIDLLGRAFEEVDFCVVRGPDRLWGGDIHTFHPPAGRFDGIIGGPPCQRFSSIARLVTHVHGEDKLAPNLIPEFERCIREAQPQWFLMENVPAAPRPAVEGYCTRSLFLNNRWVGGVQNRERVFSFGIKGQFAIDLAAYLDVELFEPLVWAPAVVAGGNGRAVPIRIGGNGKIKKSAINDQKRTTTEGVQISLALQGLPRDFFQDSPLTIKGQQKVLGNGVPLPTGRAIARAVRAALEAAEAESRCS